MISKKQKTSSVDNFPPHLPPITNSINIKESLKFIFQLLVIVVISSLSGTAAALSTIAWIMPPVVPDQFYFMDSLSGAKTAKTVDPILNQQIRQRIVNLYDIRKRTENKFYSEDALFGQVAMLSSDGWGVIYKSSYSIGEEKYWEGIDYQGVSFKVEKVLVDSELNLIYIKFTGNNFRINSFSKSDFLDTNRENLLLFSPKNVSFFNLLDKELTQKQKNFAIWNDQYGFVLPAQSVTDSFIFNTDGELVGLANNENVLVESWKIERQISFVLSQAKLTRKTLDAKGFFVTDLKFDDRWRNSTGFYISSANSLSGLVKGDVLLKISGKAVDKINLPRQIELEKDEFVATVLRGGQEIELNLKKTDLN